MKELPTLQKIDTTKLGKSIAIIERLQREFEPIPTKKKGFYEILFEKKQILLEGLTDLHGECLKNGEHEMASKIFNLIIKSNNHQ